MISLQEISDLKKLVLQHGTLLHLRTSCGDQSFAVENPNDLSVEFIKHYLDERHYPHSFTDGNTTLVVKQRG